MQSNDEKGVQINVICSKKRKFQVNRVYLKAVSIFCYFYIASFFQKKFSTSAQFDEVFHYQPMTLAT